MLNISILPHLNKSTDHRFLALLMLTLAFGSQNAQAATDYVLMWVSGSTYNIMQNNNGSIGNSQNKFNADSCIWSCSGSSSGTFSNNGKYLHYSDGLTLSTSSSSTTWNISDHHLYYHSGWFSYKIPSYYNNSWTTQNSTSSAGGKIENKDILYKFTNSSGPTEFTSLTTGTYTAYYTLSGSGTYYVFLDGKSFFTTLPTVTWSLDDGTLDNGHVKIEASTGQVTYYKWYHKATTNVVINATTTNAAGKTVTAKKTITFKSASSKVIVTSNNADLGKVYVCGDAPTKGGNKWFASDNASRAYVADYYCYANPVSEIGIFAGWATTSTETTNFISTSTDNNCEYKAGDIEGTKTYYAIFKEANKFWFNLQVINDSCCGLNAMVNPSGKSYVLGTAANNNEGTLTAILFAQPDAKHKFAYWSKTSGGDPISTDNPYSASQTSTQTNESSPAAYTYYANYEYLENPTTVTVTPSSLQLKQNQSATLGYSLTPNGCYGYVTFESSNTAVATVSSAGTVKAKGSGTAVISVKAYNVNDGVAATATVEVTVSSQTASTIGKLSFNEGTLPNTVRDSTESIGQIVFDSFDIDGVELTASNCVIVPGRRFYQDTVLVDFKGTLLEGGKEVKLTGNQQIDCETFYFGKYSKDVLDNGTLRPYTFTGWHITTPAASGASIPAISANNGKRIPGQTVFQPGDVISAEVLKDYGVLNSDGTPTGQGLTFEALWGRVCFISDDEDVTNNSHNGNDYNKPTYTVNVSNEKIYGDADSLLRDVTDPYCAVMMLTGTFRFQRSIVYKEVPKAFTYKSLQRANDGYGHIGSMVDGLRHNVIASATGEMTTHANWRLDNVKGSFDSNTNKFNNTGVTHFETTARFSGYFGSFICLSDQDSDYVVVINGGTLTGSETFNKSTVSNPLTANFNHRYFYFGRNANFTGNFYLSASGMSGTATGNTTVTVTGGYIKTLSGTNNVTHTITGNRYFNIYGDKSGNQEYDPLVGQLRPAGDAPLHGNTYVNIVGSTKLKDVFGGGYSYTATVDNVKLLIKDSHIDGSVNGGGYYGTTTGSVDVDIENSVVTGNVYGSGMGATSMVSYEDSIETRSIPTGTASAYVITDPKIEPVYYTQDLTDDYITHPQYSVLAYKLAQYEVWGGDPYSNKIDFKTVCYTYYLSMAEAGSTNISIKNSVIGLEQEQCSSERGNIYGGGDIAKVNGNTSIHIDNSTVYSSVYGGGNGLATPKPVRIGYPAPAMTAAPSPDAARAATEGVSYQSPNPTQNPESFGKDYTWSSDKSVLQAGGMDHEKQLIYSPNNSSNGWGDINGSTSVTITGATSVYGNVYGGGNSGQVTGTTTVNIGE